MDVLAQIIDFIKAVFLWSPLTGGLFIFPPLVIAVKMLRGKTQNVSDILPNRDLVKSFASNFILVLVNVLIWAVVFVAFDAVLDTFWEDIFGVTRPMIFAGLPFVVQFIALVIWLDFTNYWSHRLLHRPWMWGIHSLHHSDEHMNFSTSFRVHGLEILQMSLVAVVFVGWMNLPVEAFASAVLFRRWYSMYLHSRLPFDHGRFRKVLASPNYHRWHHADDPNVYGKNLVDMFPIWDLMFGTHYDPGTCDLPLGVSDAPSDVFRAQVFPVVYLGRLFRGRNVDSLRRDSTLG